MMKDKFERLIKKVTGNFDEPFREKEIAWKGVEQKLHKYKKRKLSIRLGIAASLIILVGSGTIFFVNNNQPTGAADYCYKVSEDLSETEFYYSGLIEDKQQQIKNARPYDKDLFKPFFNELNQLDHQYKTYKTELNDFGYREELIRALIENQQQKLNVLNKLLSKIQKIKNYENRKKEYHF